MERAREGVDWLEKPLVLFILPFLAAFALRAVLVAQGWPFWYDEIWTANFAAFPMPLGEAFRILREQDSHPPLAYLLYRLWAEVWGLRDPMTHRDPGVEVGLRLLSALLGAGTAGITALLARSLGASSLGSLLAGLLYATAPAALVKDAEVHVYPPAVFFTALALLFRARGAYLPFVLAATLAFYSHYLTLPLLLVPALRFGVRGLLPYLATLPWMLLVLPQQLATLPEKSPFNPALEEGWISITALAYLPGPILFLLGLALWSALPASLYPRRTRAAGAALITFLAVWLLVLPLATGFRTFTLRYAVLALPLLFATNAAVFSLHFRPAAASALMLVPLAVWGASFSHQAVLAYAAFRSPSVLVLRLQESPGRVVVPYGAYGTTIKYICRECDVRSWDGTTAFLRGAYWVSGRGVLDVIRKENPEVWEMLMREGQLVDQLGDVVILWVRP